MQTKFITKVFPEGQGRLASQLMSSVDCVILPLCQTSHVGKQTLPSAIAHLDQL